VVVVAEVLGPDVVEVLDEPPGTEVDDASTDEVVVGSDEVVVASGSVVAGGSSVVVVVGAVVVVVSTTTGTGASWRASVAGAAAAGRTVT
jgi:hypothetical protein